MFILAWLYYPIQLVCTLILPAIECLLYFVLEIYMVGSNFG